MINDDLEIAINHLINALQDANDEFERQKNRLISELDDFSDWDYLIEYTQQFLEICKINNDIHELIENADDLVRKLKNMKTICTLR